MSTAPSDLPAWDLATLLPDIPTPGFYEAFTGAARAAADLTAAFDAARIDRRPDGPWEPALAPAFDAAMTGYNAARERFEAVSAYLYARVSGDSRDAEAQSAMSTLHATETALHKLGTRLVAWTGSVDADALLAASEVARAHALFVRRARAEAERQMSPAEEDLAADLAQTGGAAWARLYADFTSQLAVTVDVGDGPARLPMSAVRNLAFDPRRDVRQRAYEAELGAWRDAGVVVAAAMNGVKGEVVTLARRRGWASPLDQSLFDAAIDRPTLDAMMSAVRGAFPVFRRYLRAKARALGVERLAWYDLFAPVGSAAPWSWARGTAFVQRHFEGYSARLGGLCARALRERWIDAGPRAGKQGGAFCLEVRPGESRLLLNYREAYNAVSTLAHELGHAYHNLCLADRTAVQRATPMTLAETASIFCETLVRRAALKESGDAERLAILEASLQGACQTVVDIASRFMFEEQVFAQRASRELGPDELCLLMLKAQRETYGDGLDLGTLHEFMWAAKPHYYSASTWFYNFPYTFGHLFALGLYARFEQDPDGFRKHYDALLASTGAAEAPALAARFDIDVRAESFWRESLGQLERDVALFEQLV